MLDGEQTLDKAEAESGRVVVTAEPKDTGPIKAEGTVISRGRRVGTAEERVTDGKGRLLVHGTTTCLIFES